MARGYKKRNPLKQRNQTRQTRRAQRQFNRKNSRRYEGLARSTADQRGITTAELQMRLGGQRGHQPRTRFGENYIGQMSYRGRMAEQISAAGNAVVGKIHKAYYNAMYREVRRERGLPVS